MTFPRLPDWLIYAAAVGALLVAAIGRQEHADAPEAPPPVGELADAAVAGPTPFDPTVVVEVSEHAEPGAGTAFSVGPAGVWVTARHVVDGCRRAALVVGDGRGVAAQIRVDPRSEAAVLTTQGGVAPLPLGLSEPLKRGERAFHPGFPQGRAGEATSRLIGRENLVVRGRGARIESVLAWAETGRTEGLRGTLGGLSGAPALDAAGRVVGVTIAEAPRRGRIYTTAPETTRVLLQGLAPADAHAGEPLTTDNYGRIADELRRGLRVAQVICLA